MDPSELFSFISGRIVTKILLDATHLGTHTITGRVKEFEDRLVQRKDGAASICYSEATIEQNVVGTRDFSIDIEIKDIRPQCPVCEECEECEVTVTGLSPSSGEAGETVMITGTGFSTTIIENRVVFLGGSGSSDDLPALVSSTPAPTPSSLTVLVPSGAVTGRISVTVGGQTATSKIDFTVSVGSISITNIRAVRADVGDTITISGLGFSTTAQENEVIFNGDAIIVGDDVTTTSFEATATSLKVEVPTGAKPGNISVRVNDQTAVSGQTFIVLAGLYFSSLKRRFHRKERQKSTCLSKDMRQIFGFPITSSSGTKPQ